MWDISRGGRDSAVVVLGCGLEGAGRDNESVIVLAQGGQTDCLVGNTGPSCCCKNPGLPIQLQHVPFGHKHAGGVSVENNDHSIGKPEPPAHSVYC